VAVLSTPSIDHHEAKRGAKVTRLDSQNLHLSKSESENKGGGRRAATNRSEQLGRPVCGRVSRRGGARVTACATAGRPGGASEYADMVGSTPPAGARGRRRAGGGGLSRVEERRCGRGEVGYSTRLFPTAAEPARLEVPDSCSKLAGEEAAGSAGGDRGRPVDLTRWPAGSSVTTRRGQAGFLELATGAAQAERGCVEAYATRSGSARCVTTHRFPSNLRASYERDAPLSGRLGPWWGDAQCSFIPHPRAGEVTARCR